MKLWKYHTPSGTVSQVEGEPWPGRDEHGARCYENTHFITEAEAWEYMAKDAEAAVLLTGARVTRAREMLRAAEEAASIAYVNYEIVCTNRRQAGQAKS